MSILNCVMAVVFSMPMSFTNADLCDQARATVAEGLIDQQYNLVESMLAEGAARAAEKAWRDAKIVEDMALAQMLRVMADPMATPDQKQQAIDVSRAATTKRLVAEVEMLRCQVWVLKVKQEMQMIRQKIEEARAYLTAHCG